MINLEMSELVNTAAFPHLKIILASKSPRRQMLLKELGLPYQLVTREVDESFPEHMQSIDVALYLANKKADAFEDFIAKDFTIITADTLVSLNGHVINKPVDFQDAVQILKRLSGNMHEVISGVCVYNSQKRHAFTVTTKVYFNELSEEEILFYLQRCKPMDKAGAYGIQDWIGLVGIGRIEGSYFNVMGLPVAELYEQLKKF